MSENLSAQAVSVKYGDTEVVHDASLTLEPGLVTAVVGPNGSGKSTLLRAMARLADSSGDVTLGEQNVRQFSQREFAKRVAMLSANHSQPSGLTVREVVSFGRHPHRTGWRSQDPEGQQAIERALELTGTGELASQQIDSLSSGQTQRVWLATCLAQHTGILLLDEPTNFLDLRYQFEILDIVRELAELHDVAVGIVLHDLNLAASVADQIALVNRGIIERIGTPAEVLTSEALSRVYEIPLRVEIDEAGLHVRANRTRALANR